MTEPTILTPFTEFWAKLFERLVIDPLFRFLEHRSERTRALLIIASGVLVILSAVWAIWSLTTYSRFMAATFAQPLEPNEQAYRGLEAYLLSVLPRDVDGIWGAGSGPREVAVLRQRLDEVVSPSRLAALADSVHLSFYVPPVDSMDHREGPPSIRETYFTDVDLASSAYLFLPAVFVDVDSSQLPPRHPKSRVLNDAIRKLPAQWMELRAARMSTHVLESLDNQTVDGMPVVQSYFMGDRGTLMIRNNRRRTGEVYAGKFTPTRYFAERPYFKNAGKSRRRIGSFDFATQPYIDYGGFGVVRTYTIKLTLPNHHQAMIGIDCTFADGDSLIRARVRTLLPLLHALARQKPDEFSLRFGKAATPDELEGVPPWLQRAASEERSAAEIQGKILCDHDFGASGKTFQFAIPMGPGDARGDEDATRYILAVLDLDAMNNVWIPGAVCVAMCVLFGGILQFLYQQHIAQPREQGKVMSGVSRMMDDTDTPFAWFDGRNRFVRANVAMARALGYSSTKKLMFSPSGRRRTFREFLWLDDQAAYDAMLNQGRLGKRTAPYWCRLRDAGGHWITVRVHGERMPLAARRRGEGPHRFGVFIDYPRKVAEAGREGPPQALPVLPA